MGVSLDVGKREFCGFGYGTMSTLIEGICEFLKKIYTDEKSLNAISALENYKISSYHISGENCKVLYEMLSCDDFDKDIIEYFTKEYFIDPFNYLGFYSGPFYYNFGERTGINTISSTLSYESCEALKKVNDKTEHQIYYDRVDNEINLQRPAINVEFSDIEYGHLNGALQRFIIIIGYSAMTNQDLIIS